MEDISSLSDLTTPTSEPHELDYYDQEQDDNDIANNIERESKEIIDSSEVSNKKNNKKVNKKIDDNKTETKMNIVEAYIKKRKQLIILISGFSGCGKTVIAKNISKDFNISFLNLNNFMKKDYAETSEPKEILGKKIIDWDDPNAIEWDEFNEAVMKNKNVIVSGFGFPLENLKFKTDIHIHLKIPKDFLIKNRKEYKLENEDSKLNDIDEKLERTILNALSYPHYMAILSKSKVDLTIQVKENLKETYDEVFDSLINIIDKKVYSKK